MVKENIRRLKNFNIVTETSTFIKWFFISVFIGLTVGLVGVGFHYSIDLVTELRNEHTWLIYLLPLGGLVIVLLYHLCKKDDDKGTNFILSAVRQNEKISVLTAPLIFIASTITHLLGGSSGREGAALQLGGSIAYNIGKLFKLDEKDKKIITMCGMSAAFSALFGTPVTAAVFAIEVVNVGVMHFSAIVPCAVSAIVGTKLAEILGVSPTAFLLSGTPQLDWLSVLKVSVLSILCAVLSVIFCITMHKSEKLYAKLFPNRYIRIAVGGALVILLTLIVGTYDYNGAGMNIVEKALSGEAKYEAFILKIIFTALTLSAGYKGGEIVPVFFTGATFGNVAGKLVGLSPSFGAGIGLVSLFCGVTNCPITSIILSVELFGSDGLVFFLLSCAFSYMLSGYYGLYHGQKIVYSKFKPEFIDRNAG